MKKKPYDINNKIRNNKLCIDLTQVGFNLYGNIIGFYPKIKKVKPELVVLLPYLGLKVIGRVQNIVLLMGEWITINSR